MACNRPWILFSVIATAAGFAVVLGPNVGSDGALPVVVTLVGWARGGRESPCRLRIPAALETAAIWFLGVNAFDRQVCGIKPVLC